MTGKLAIITGTSSGIGQSLADRLLSEGWRVFGLARREVKHADPAYRHIQADLSDPSVAMSIIAPMIEAELAFSDFNRLALVNNAASTGQLRHYGSLSAGEAFRNIAINLSAPMALMDMALRVTPEGAAIRIVNVSTGLATSPMAGGSEYCASKAGLRMAGQVMAAELEAGGRENAAVLSYEPGIVDTEMQQVLRGQSTDDFPTAVMFQQFNEEGRLAAADDVLEPMVNFLESDETGGFLERRFGDS